MSQSRRYAVLTGGIGGAKLALGLSKALEPGQLSAIVNTGDDFEHLGLPISPDMDTLMYTLADAVDEDTGWGRRDETWHFMAALADLGGETWFRIGDRDLATHIRRTELLARGLRLSEATYREVFNSVNDTIWIHDIETFRFIDVNDKVTEMFGYTVGEALELSVEEISSGVPPYTQETAAELMKQAARSAGRQRTDLLR